MNRGVTLPELTVVLLLLGIGAPPVLGHLRAQRDALAVRAAREEVIALFHRARMEARIRGEAVVVVEEGAGVALLAPEGERLGRAAPQERGVRLLVGGARTRVEIRFGSLGLASFASTTLDFERGRRRARLVVSTHGRVRR